VKSYINKLSLQFKTAHRKTKMSFRDLKQNRTKQLEKIAETFKKPQGNFSKDDDEGFWYPGVDKSGNGFAIIRFLPAPEGEDSPTTRIYRRSFQGPTGKWYIENCLTTINQTDPVGEYNNQLIAADGGSWEKCSDRTKEKVRLGNRKETYVANVYIIKDSLNPENEGKVFYFRFGRKLAGFIDEAMNPTVEYEGHEPTRINPFDMWGDGANFIMRIRTKDKYRNYDKSSWDEPSEFLKNDKEREEVYGQIKPLAQFTSPDKFKSYEELKAKFNAVLGLGGALAATKTSFATESAAAQKEESAPWDSETIEEEDFSKLFDDD